VRKRIRALPPYVWASTGDLLVVLEFLKDDSEGAVPDNVLDALGLAEERREWKQTEARLMI
jgi:hypothetical protein